MFKIKKDKEVINKEIKNRFYHIVREDFDYAVEATRRNEYSRYWIPRLFWMSVALNTISIFLLLYALFSWSQKPDFSYFASYDDGRVEKIEHIPGEVVRELLANNTKNNASPRLNLAPINPDTTLNLSIYDVDSFAEYNKIESPQTDNALVDGAVAVETQPAAVNEEPVIKETPPQ